MSGSMVWSMPEICWAWDRGKGMQIWAWQHLAVIPNTKEAEAGRSSLRVACTML